MFVKKNNILRSVLTVFIIAGLSNSGFSAVNSISTRIRSLNPRFAGVIADDYTDLIANPARIKSTPTSIYSRFTSAGGETTLGYSRGPILLLGEGSSSLSKREDVNTPGILSSDVDDFSNFDFIFGAAFSFRSNPNKFIGINLAPTGNISSFSSRSSTLLSDGTLRTTTMFDSYSRKLGGGLSVGYFNKEENKETDLVLSGNLSKTYRTLESKSFGQSFTSNQDNPLVGGMSLSRGHRDTRDIPLISNSRYGLSWNNSQISQVGTEGFIRDITSDNNTFTAFYDKAWIWKPLAQITGYSSVQISGNYSREEEIVERISGETNSFGGTFSVPIAAEYTPIRFLTVRMGWAANWSGSGSKTKTDLSTIGVPETKTNSRTFAYSSDSFTAGFGLKPVESIAIDFQTSTSDLAKADSWTVQLRYIF